MKEHVGHKTILTLEKKIKILKSENCQTPFELLFSYGNNKTNAFNICQDHIQGMAHYGILFYFHSLSG